MPANIFMMLYNVDKHVGKDFEDDSGRGYFVGGGGYSRAHIVGPTWHTEANARRIARVPELEALALAGAELAEALRECLKEHGGFTIKGGCEHASRKALAAWEKANE